MQHLFQRLYIDLAFPGGLKLYQMIKVRALASKIEGFVFRIRIIKICPKHHCDALLNIEIPLSPSEIEIGAERFPNPIIRDEIFETWILTTETGFWVIIDRKLIKRDYPYKFPFTEDHYLMVGGGYPVLEVDVKSGYDWWKDY